jgi:glycosyltransferase involved in cell wall biosynthesis
MSAGQRSAPGELVEFVLPVYNEAHVLATSVERLMAAAAEWSGFPWRIWIVDNASVDGTSQEGERLAREHERVRFTRLQRKGRGLALRHAWSETDAPLSLYMDIDLSTELEAVLPAVASLREGADLVTGSRLHPESRVTRSFKREFFARCYNVLVKGVFPSRSFNDAQCGFKGVRVATVRPLLPLVENDNWFFDTELMLLMEYGGLRVHSLPVEWIEDLDSRVQIPAYIAENIEGLIRVRRTLGSSLRAMRT